MQPEAVSKQPVKTKPFPRQRHYLAVFFLSFLWGTFGVDRMYLGKWGTGILKLVTFGGLGFWVLVDLILILSGSMRDKQGREILQYAEYKRFSYLTILIFALVMGAVILINGITLIVIVTQFIEALQNGTTSIPGLDGLMNGVNGNPLGLPPDLEGYY